ncbi:MAG: TonB-dependent receptor [Woeseia sp.]
MQRIRTAFANGVALLSVLTASGAAAQSIEEIIVTATRRQADVQDVPISISAYSGNFLADSGIDTLQDLAAYAPNLTFTTGSQPTNARIAIRGIGSVSNNAIEPAVGVFVDGVYLPRSGSVLGNLLDMQVVEVLRGPQGTLFGRNTAAGALNLRSNDPSDAFEGYVLAELGNYRASSLKAVVSGPLADSVAGRFAVRRSEHDGIAYNQFDDRQVGEREDLGARGKLLFNISENLEVKWTVDYNEIKSGGNILELDPTTSNPIFEGAQINLFGTSALTADGRDHIISQDHRDRLADEQWGSSIDLNYQFGDFTVRSITALRDWQADTYESAFRLPADILPRSTRYDTRTVSQELQLLSPSGQFAEYIVGVFLYDEDYAIDQTFDAGADACSPLVFAVAGAAAAAACANASQSPAVASEFSQSLQSVATFAQATLHFSDVFALTAGARYTSDDKEGSFNQVLPNPILGSLFRVPESEPDLRSNDAAWTWLLTATFNPADNLMLFATGSTGFKGGGFNSEGASVALGSAARTFEPEESRNVELGFKSTAFDRRLVANVTLYHTQVKRFQDRSFDGTSFITRNAGSRTQSGFESDLALRPIDQLTLLFGLSYLDAKFDSFVAASPLPGSTVAQDLSGKRPHATPEWQGSLVADWRSPLAAGDLEWFMRGGLQYVGEQNVGGNTNLNPQTMEDGYLLTDLRLGFGDDRWQVYAYVSNLGDERYCQSKFDQPLGGAFGAVNVAANTTAQRCVLSSPRTFGLSLRYEL